MATARALQIYGSHRRGFLQLRLFQCGRALCGGEKLDRRPSRLLCSRCTAAIEFGSWVRCAEGARWGVKRFKRTWRRLQGWDHSWRVAHSRQVSQTDSLTMCTDGGVGLDSHCAAADLENTKSKLFGIQHNSECPPVWSP